MTGLVVTTRITDATPAAFSSHVDQRFQEDMIAEQQLGEYPLGRMVDLIIGEEDVIFYQSHKRVDVVQMIEIWLRKHSMKRDGTMWETVNSLMT